MIKERLPSRAAIKNKLVNNAEWVISGMGAFVALWIFAGGPHLAHSGEGLWIFDYYYGDQKLTIVDFEDESVTFVNFYKAGAVLSEYDLTPDQPGAPFHSLTFIPESVLRPKDVPLPREPRA